MKSKKDKNKMENGETKNEAAEDAANVENENTDNNKVEVEIEKPEDDLQMRLQKLEEEKKDLHERLLRRMAEFENFKRRTESDQVNLLKFAGEHIIVDLLPIYDDLERSLNHVDEENKDSLIHGLKLVFDKFKKVLETHGIKKIEAKGKEFDFNYHEALMRQESDTVPPDTVIEVFDNGYLYKDKVIKHAKVSVSTPPANSEEEEAKSEKNNETDKSQD